MRQLTKIFLLIIIAIILGTFVIAIILQTGWFKQWLKQALIHHAQQEVIGQLQLGDISGGLFSGFSSKNIHWIVEGDTLMSLAQLRFNMQPLELLNKAIVIQNLEIHFPRVFISQNIDGEWNFAHLVKPKQTATTSSWRLQLKSVHLDDGRLTVRGTNPQLFLQLHDIEIKLAAHYLVGLTIGQLQRCHFQVTDYDFTLDNLSGFFIIRRDSLYCKNMTLNTSRSAFQFDLQLPLKGTSGFHFTMSAQDLDLQDVRAFMPQFPSSKRIPMKGSALMTADSLLWHVQAGTNNQSLTIQGNCSVPLGKTPLRLQVVFDHLSLADWLDRPPLPMTLNGVLSLTGSGFDQHSANWQLSAEFNHSRIQQTELVRSSIEGSLRGDSLKTNFVLNGGWGEVSSQASIVSIYHKPNYSLHLGCRRLNLAPFLGSKTPSSNINFDATVSGNGFDPKAAQLSFSFTASPSTIETIPLEKLQSAGSYHNGTFLLDSLSAFSVLGKVHLKGSRNSTGWLDLHYNGQIEDTTFIKQWLKIPKMKINAAFNGQLRGSTDSLETHGDLTLHDAIYQDISLNRLQGKWRISGLGSNPYGTISLQSSGLSFSPAVAVDSTCIDGRVFKDFVFLESRIHFADSIWTKLRTELRRIDTTLICMFTDIKFAFKNQLWSGGSDSTVLHLSPSALSIKHFSLSFQDQSITLNGSLGDSTADPLKLYCNNFHLDAFAGLFPPSWRLAGEIDWHAQLYGNLSDPIIVNSAIWRNGRLGSFLFDTLKVTLEYKNEAILAQMQLTHKQKKFLTLSGHLPIGISLEKPSANLFTERPLQARIQLQEMPLSFFSAFVPDLMINGRVSGLMQLQNSLNHPQPSGSLTFEAERIDSPSLGKPWRQVKARLELDSTAIWLKNISVKGGDGTLRGEGFISYDLHHLAKPFGKYFIRLRPNGFTPVDLREVSITLDGDIRLEEKDQTATLSGELTIQRSRFDLTELLATPSTILLPDRPLLVVSQEDTLHRSYDVSVLAPSWLKYFDKIRGSIKIEVPRNTWLRSKEMNIEIAGSLDLVKQGAFAELFGSIRILRGSYDLYSRRFDIQSGTLTFLGGEKFNPNVDLEAEYVFRSVDRSKKTLKLIVGGQLFNPTMRFTLDGLDISETDAIAYLLFGRSFDLLTQGEKSDLQQNQPQADMSGEAMKQLLSWQITGRLSNSLRQQLKLDVIEFRGDQNWRQATIVVGKYLTNDLFISYQRDFDFSRPNAAVPEQVTLEYEILRSLYIQATRSDESRTGFDIIWKYEK